MWIWRCRINPASIPDYNDCIAITWGQLMSSITVRNLDEAVKNSLRVRAARHGWSMEQEVRQILQQTVAPEQVGAISFAERINSRFVGLQGDSLPIPPRQIARTPPVFDAS
jgi:plasmid stability protein